MRACEIFFLICVTLVLANSTSAERPCEEIVDKSWVPFGTIKICYMNSIAIDSKNFSITSDRDVTVKGFYALNNKKLKYLPNNLGSNFPNLLGLYVAGCSVKEVSKQNFDGLSNLRTLYLQNNQIKKIDDDTFEHIPAVEYIFLYDNKIKKLSGRAFASLHKLKWVYLKGNACIDEYFDTPVRIAEMSRTISEKCGFTDDEPSSTETAKPETDLTPQSEELQALKMEMAKLRIEKAEADLQIAHHNAVKAQLKETCDARIELKVQEIFQKNEKIKQCEKKIQILGGDDSC